MVAQQIFKIKNRLSVQKPVSRKNPHYPISNLLLIVLLYIVEAEKGCKKKSLNILSLAAYLLKSHRISCLGRFCFAALSSLLYTKAMFYLFIIMKSRSISSARHVSNKGTYSTALLSVFHWQYGY